MSMKFQLHVNVEIVEISGKFRFKTQKVVNYPAHIKIVGILTFMSRSNFSLSGPSNQMDSLSVCISIWRHQKHIYFLTDPDEDRRYDS